MWEKKDDNNSGGIHDRDDTYTWADAVSVFVDRLNNRCAGDEQIDCTAHGDSDCVGVGGPCGFAGYRDWRLPEVNRCRSERVAGAVSLSEFETCTGVRGY